MLTRSPLWRTLVASMAVWALVVQMEPATLHLCVKHSPQVSAGTEQPAAHHHAAPADSPSTGNEPANECCTCPDGCAVAAAVRVPQANQLVIPAARLAAPRTPQPRDDVRPASTSRLLPFANGPPSLV